MKKKHYATCFFMRIMSWFLGGHTNIRTMSGTPVVEEDQKARPIRRKVYTVTPNLVSKLISFHQKLLPPWNGMGVGPLINEEGDDSKANCGVRSQKFEDTERKTGVSCWYCKFHCLFARFFKVSLKFSFIDIHVWQSQSAFGSLIIIIKKVALLRLRTIKISFGCFLQGRPVVVAVSFSTA